MRAVFVAALGVVVLAAIGGARSEDASEYYPLTAAPETHKVLLENEFVVVLDVSIPAGITVPAHQHPWPAVFITLNPAHLVFRNLAGEVVRDPGPPLEVHDRPKVEWREPDAEPVVISNVGSSEQRALRIELKFLPH